MRALYIMIFGVLGVLSRYYAGTFVAKVLSPTFPYGTFMINITGAFLIGMVQVLGIERNSIPPDLRVGIMVGFLGGYTTFSSYSLESFRLIEQAEFLKAAAYFILSPALGLLAVTGGVFFARIWFGGP